MKQKYFEQKKNAKQRNIEWQFTFDEWITWWGDDIVNRGCLKGQLVMARNGDTGPYHPDNVRKATCGENVVEAHIGKISAFKGKKQTEKGLASIIERANSKRNTTVFEQLTCPHCGTTTNKGNAKRWHFNNCKG